MPPADQRFQLVSDHLPTGDQPDAIGGIVSRLRAGQPAITLLGATGTGKTFTMANVIREVQRPTLIISHNKTLAAQLYEEMRELFPKNAVSYFVSYYDYYQPEAYIPQRDIYIEKDASRNDDLDRLRLSATSSLLSRRDTIVVASVSCIFGLGSPDLYGAKVLAITVGDTVDRRELLLALADMQYQRNEVEFKRGVYRVRGDVIELYPAYEKFAVRVEMFGDDVEAIQLIDPTSGEVLADERQFFVFPAVHYVTPGDQMQRIIDAIKAELEGCIGQLHSEGKVLEATRLAARTRYDLEMIEEVGFCSGVENYSRYFDGRKPGEKPYTLLDYFERSPGVKDTGWLLMIDESHVTVPQVRAMYNGDRQRKQVLVDHGFRLPSALDNRPLRFEEFERSVPQTVYVSATPGPYELQRSEGDIVEQVIRPTGLLDPVIDVRPARNQVPDLIEECIATAGKGERVLVTALTKKLCEQLAAYLDERGVRVRYLHSEVETLDRVQILRELREGEFDILVGVNLLREGLDLPEVSLVAVLDADKEGFLRNATSLIQTIGRAARNVRGRAILYADKITPSMRHAIDETDRRREKQQAYNEAHGIEPRTIVKAIRQGIELELRARRTARQAVNLSEDEFAKEELITALEEEMFEAAEKLEFERAAALRDKIEAAKALESATVRMSDVDARLYGEEHASSKPGAPGSRPRKRKRIRKKE